MRRFIERAEGGGVERSPTCFAKQNNNSNSQSTLCDLLKQINAYRSMKASVGVTNKLCRTTESNTLTQHTLKAGQTILSGLLINSEKNRDLVERMWRQITSPNMKKCLPLGLFKAWESLTKRIVSVWTCFTHHATLKTFDKTVQQTLPNTCPKP